MQPITTESIQKLLKTQSLGRIIHYFQETGSTNTIAFELAEKGAPHGTVVIADSQTAGRGRLERIWISPPGVNLYMSIVLRPGISANDAPIITLLSSIAVVEAIKLEGVESQIKWPNDVLVTGKKIAGTLTEMQPEGSKVSFVILGIGINLNLTREMMRQEMREVEPMATSLREAAGHEIDRAKFTATLINSLEIWYQKFLKDGKPLIIKEWTDRWEALDKKVEVIVNERAIRGSALGIDENGYLLIKKDNGSIETVIAGDVTLL